MAITVSQLEQAASRSRTSGFRSIVEARNSGIKTAFLCHSHHDKRLVEGLVVLLHDNGWDVYVDWMDASMSGTPTSATATNIKRRIIQTDYFLFLATPNSMESRWCPWEIGYADGTKEIDRIIIIPTTHGYTTYGNEYLGLYQKITDVNGGGLGIFEPGKENGRYIRSLG